MAPPSGDAFYPFAAADLAAPATAEVNTVRELAGRGVPSVVAAAPQPTGNLAPVGG